MIVQLDSGKETEEEKLGKKNGGKDEETTNEPREDVDARHCVHSILPGEIVVVRCDGSI